MDIEVKQMSNIELVRHCAASPGDRLAWDEFVNRFTPCLTLYVARALKLHASWGRELNYESLRETIHDLVQDVFLRLLNHQQQALRSFRGEREHSIYLYLARIATRVVIDYLREHAATPGPTEFISWHQLFGQESSTAGSSLDKPLAPQPSYTDRQLEQQLTILDVRRRLERLLPQEHRERNILLFILHVFDGLAAHDLAHQSGWGLTAKGIESILLRLKEKLREQLQLERDQATGSS